MSLSFFLKASTSDRRCAPQSLERDEKRKREQDGEPTAMRRKY
jgi:hypothetical protein